MRVPATDGEFGDHLRGRLGNFDGDYQRLEPELFVESGRRDLRFHHRVARHNDDLHRDGDHSCFSIVRI